MDIPASLVKTLREKSGAGMMDCKTALVQTEGDLEKAIDYLRKKGLADASKKAGRRTTEGLVHSYIHVGGRIGVLVEVNCETDFVARTPDFQQFCRDLAMQVAAMNPAYIAPEDAPPGTSPEARKAACLLEQPFVKDQGTTAGELLKALVAKTGEKVVITRFVRFALGEGAEGANGR